MSKKNLELNDQASGSNLSTSGKQKPSTVLPTFFKWFKKSNHKKSSKHGGISSFGSQDCSSQETLSETSSPVLLQKHLTPSSSCDSVISTSTTGFAFIRPNNYEQNVENNTNILNFSNSDIDSDSLLRRVRIHNRQRLQNNEKKISLKEKYCLFESDTLNSNFRSFNNFDLVHDRSLPNSKKVSSKTNSPLSPQRYRHRRTASDSSKDKKSRAYVHVKGKRKAPQPPSAEQTTSANQNCYNESILEIKSHVAKPTESQRQTQIKQKNVPDGQNQLKVNSSMYASTSPTSTLGSKKRKAPAPPYLGSPVDETQRSSIFSDGLLNEQDMHSIFGDALSAQHNFNDTLVLKNLPSTAKSIINQQQDNNIQITNLSTQISPKPWYKRPINTNLDSSIPFKREIILRTMEKRKCNQKEKSESVLSQSETVHSRTSIFDSGANKFGFFMRHKDDDNKSKNKEKRKSGIAIPNISELDREAVEIFNKHQERDGKDNKNDHFFLQQKMFKPNIDVVNEEINLSNLESNDQTITTKELIAKFDSSENSTKIHLNTSYIGQIDKFCYKKDTQTDLQGSYLNNLVKQSNKLNEMKAVPRLSENIEVLKGQNQNSMVDSFPIHTNDTKLTIMTWKCPFCTLENSSWRIICEACEKLKPFEKIINNTSKDLTKIGPTIIPLNSNTEQKTKNIGLNAGNSISCESKLKDSVNNKQLKSSGEDITKVSSNKYLDMVVDKTSDEKKLNTDLKLTQYEGKDLKQPLLDSSVVLTTVTPVFYAIKSCQNVCESITADKKLSDGNLSIENIRNARLAKFDLKKSKKFNEETNLTDKNWLTAERKRLREKIRAMNAKALADKYPIIINKNLKETENKKGNTEEKGNSEIIFHPTENVQSLNVQNVDETNNENEYNRGAIKKNIHKIVKKKNSNCSISIDPCFTETNTPKKVSSSAQTTSVVKKPLTPLNELETIKNHLDLYPNFRNKSVNNNVIDKVDESSKNPTIDSSFSNCNVRKTNTLALNKIMRDLEIAISDGNHELAANLAMDLAKLKVSLQVTKTTTKRNSGTETDFNQTILVDLFIEDKTTRKGPIQLKIRPFMTIMELKQTIHKDFKIKINAQRWLINGTFILNNNITLVECGVKNSSSTFHLYVITPEIKEKFNMKIPATMKVQPEGDNLSDSSSISFNEESTYDNVFNQGAVAMPIKRTKENSDEYDDHWQCSLCTLVNKPNSFFCEACSKVKPKDYDRRKPIEYNFFKESSTFDNTNKIPLRTQEKRNDLNKISPNRKSSDIFNIIEQKETIDMFVPIQLENLLNPILKSSKNFSSPNITKCKYRGVDNFNPNRVDNIVEIKDNRKINGLKETLSSIGGENMNLPSVYTPNHYLELLKLNEADIVVNFDSFECPICFQIILPNDGAVLRDCLHTFCKECLRKTIQHCDEAVVKCPFMDSLYSCENNLQEREIKALVSTEVYEKHLAKSIREAEHKIENAFHCKTPNCRGWCIYEDNVNQFRCPVCKISNCLTCRIIHDGLTCKQFQDRLNSDCDSNIEARRTRDMLAKMVEKGEAMNCPTCQVIMMKKWGCDWLKCSMCKTEVCWVTRGPRWGPNGKGDTTGGCKCGVDGKKCHPKCNYCH